MEIIRGCEMDFVLQRIRICFFIRFGLCERLRTPYSTYTPIGQKEVPSVFVTDPGSRSSPESRQLEVVSEKFGVFNNFLIFRLIKVVKRSWRRN